MSRIDEVLRMREGAVRNPAANPAPVDVNPSVLVQYAAEQATPEAPQEIALDALQSEAPARSAAPRNAPANGAPSRSTVSSNTASNATASDTATFDTESPSVSSARPLRERSFDDDERRARLVTGSPSTASLEQYRRLAAALHDEQVQGQIKTIMITSALPGEGKTLTVVNLALTLSESYRRRVLIVDADLRWPSVHTVLDIPNDRGLTEALRDPSQEPHLVHVSSRLSVLVAGRPGPSPLAGLTSKRMGKLLEECAARFDWVLVDTPPVGVLPDAQPLARLIGGVILVIGARSTPANAVERAIAELGGPDSIIGTVLNRVEERQIPESSYYAQYDR